VSSLPQSGYPKQGYVLSSILEYLNTLKNYGPPIGTAYELAALITTRCIAAFNSERAPHAQEIPKIVDIFSESLQVLVSPLDFVLMTTSDVAQSNEGKKLYGETLHSTHRLNTLVNEEEQNEAISVLTSRLLETQMLLKLRDIRDELEIISLLQEDQVRVVQDMERMVGRKEDQQYQLGYKRLRDEFDGQLVAVANMTKVAARISADVCFMTGTDVH
jgi:hypothetical protein